MGKMTGKYCVDIKREKMHAVAGIFQSGIGGIWPGVDFDQLAKSKYLKNNENNGMVFIPMIATKNNVKSIENLFSRNKREPIIQKKQYNYTRNKKIHWVNWT